MTADLATTYLGIDLVSPIIIGSCPLTAEPEAVRQLVEAGAGAVVLPSLLQEQITFSDLKASDPLGAIERSGYQPQQDKYNGGPENYLQTIRYLKTAHQLPIFASMNGSTSGDWLDFAAKIEAAGADALELNLQPVIDDSAKTAAAIESSLCEMVRRVTGQITIPVAVKLSHRYTNPVSVAKQIESSGAAGVVLFTHHPRWDVSIDRMHWTVSWELSPADSIGPILEGVVRHRTGGLNISIAASGGIRTCEDAIKAMIAGADAVMVTSEIYRAGPDVIRSMVDGISHFVDASRFGSLREFQHSRPKVDISRDHLTRIEYVDPLTRTDRYHDPTPPVPHESGDCYGHQSSVQTKTDESR